MQQENLKNKIQEKQIHKAFFQNYENPITENNFSSIWLHKGINSPQEEGMYTFLQDRNFFLGQESKKKCPHCGKAIRTVDHLATNCGKLLPFDYTQRHNEVLKCIHLNLCRQFNFTDNHKLRLHKITKKIENCYASIITDMPIATDIQVQANRPDIIVYDKIKKEITIIEVGVTSQQNLQTTEITKKRKYDLLAKELNQLENMPVKIVPFVITWDGVVTKYNKDYRETLKITDKMLAYIQTVVLKKTLETISSEYRQNRSYQPSKKQEEEKELVERLYEVCLQFAQQEEIVEADRLEENVSCGS